MTDQISFRNKWNETRLLVINMVFTSCSCPAERLKTQDLRKLGNISKISKLIELLPIGQLSPPQKKKIRILPIPAKTSWNVEIGHPHHLAMHYFTWKLELVSNIPSMNLVQMHYFWIKEMELRNWSSLKRAQTNSLFDKKVLNLASYWRLAFVLIS